MPFSLGLWTMRIYSIGAVMPFNLGYVPLGHKLLPFAIFGETWHTKQRYEHITMIEKINIIILVMQSCCLSHVLKRSYQADFKSVCYWNLQRWF